MYSYQYDPDTGGILLTDTHSLFSKEPRPVYSRELDLLGFDQIWNYEKTDDTPYLWAEAQFYFYRGKRVAKTIGGSLYERPVIELEKDETGNEILPTGSILTPIDLAAMVEKSRNLVGILECETVKKIFDVYRRHHEKLDCFHVAFSGGKDSIVLLELVRRALPANSFITIFGDTGMEFPDTYQTVDAIEAKCKENGLAFYRASSRFRPDESWRLFGPPSRVLRWCCSVHKSAPQTLKLREILGKKDYTGMDFVGVRAHESAARSEYELENFGKKQKGQYSCNPLLDWGSAEIWLYIFSRHLVINNAYKKGISRVGCLFCPMGAGNKNDWFRIKNYPEKVTHYINLIKEFVADENIESYIANGGWQSRSSGRDLKGIFPKVSEQCIDGKLKISAKCSFSSWREWSKTLPPTCQYAVKQEENCIVIETEAANLRPVDGKFLRQTVQKASYCVGCGACEANCSHGCIDFSGGIKIDECIHCGQCQAIPYGCYIADSLKQPLESKKMKASLNTFDDHAPMPNWITDFFKRGNEFIAENELGPNQKTKFKRFLSDAALISKNKTTEFFDAVRKIGFNTVDAWGLIYINLVISNPQMNWYMRNLPLSVPKNDKEVINSLLACGVTEKGARSIYKSFKRLCETPLGKKLNFGTFTTSGHTLTTIIRTKPVVPSSNVFLYALYKFAEACDGYYEFTLSRLMDFSLESAGASPAEIFGLPREEMEQFLNSLSRSRPEFVSYTTTHDLEVIRLAEDKNSADVLSLFQEIGK